MGRVAYYFPPMLPEDMLIDEVKTGEIDPKLWIALEDLHDGWEQCGEVGQEVYGAGIAFGVIPKQYFKLQAGNLVLFCDYPIKKAKLTKASASVHIDGDPRLNCRLMVLSPDGKMDFELKASTGSSGEVIKPVKEQKDLIEFNVYGDQQVTISWTAKASAKG